MWKLFFTTFDTSACFSNLLIRLANNEHKMVYGDLNKILWYRIMIYLIFAIKLCVEFNAN